jgi:hypothetical protein
MGPSKVTFGDALDCARDLRAPSMSIQLSREDWIRRLVFRCEVGSQMESRASPASMDLRVRSEPATEFQEGQMQLTVLSSENCPPVKNFN